MISMNFIRTVVSLLVIGIAPNVNAKDCDVYDWQLNGCSLAGWENYLGNLGLGTDNCNDHDRCYRIIGNTKSACDQEFHKVLKNRCYWNGVILPHGPLCLLEADLAFNFVKDSDTALSGYTNHQKRAVKYFSDTAGKVSSGECDKILNAPAWTTVGNTSTQSHLIRRMYHANGTGIPSAATISGLLDFLALSGADTNDDWRFTLGSYLFKNQIQDLENIVTQDNFVNDVLSGQIELPDRLTLSTNGGIGEESNPRLLTSRHFSAVLNLSM